MLWQHIPIISDLIFNSILGSAFAISNFSVRLKSHHLVPHVWRDSCFCKAPFDGESLSESFKFQVNLKCLLLFHQCGVDNFLWLLYRALNSPSPAVSYIYVFVFGFKYVILLINTDRHFKVLLGNYISQIKSQLANE